MKASPIAQEPKVFRRAYAAVALALVVLVLAAREVYLLDLPAWVYQGAVLAELAAGRPAGAYALVPYPVPNALSTVFFALTAPLLGPVGAGKAFVALYLAAALAVAYALSRAAEPGTAARRAAVLAATLFVSSSFWNGYLNFQVGLVVGAAFVALWLRRGRPGPLAVLAFTVGLFFTHAIPFAVVALGVGLDALRRRDVRTLAALVPPAALTAWYVAGRLGAASDEFREAVIAPEGLLYTLLYKGYTVLKLGPFQHVVGLDGRGYLEAVPGLYGALLALSATFVAALAAGVVWGVVWVFRAGGSRRWAAGYGVGVAVTALLMPAFALNVINPGERVAACAALLLVAVVPLPRRLLTALAVVALGFLAYDAVYLAAQLGGLPPAERARAYAERVEAVRAQAEVEAEHVGAFRDPHAYATEELYPDTRLKYLNHAVYFHAPLYEAAARGDFSLPSFDSGLLTERLAP